MAQNLGNLFIDAVGGISDKSIYGRSITNTNVTVSSEIKFNDKDTMYFNGIDSRLDLAAVGDWNLGYGALTVDMWVRMDDAMAHNSFMAAYIGAGQGWNFRSYGGVPDATVYANLGYQLMQPWAPESLTWQHIALVRDDTTFQVYLNGVAIDDTPIGLGSNLSASGRSLVIGSEATDGNQHMFKGYMSNIRLIKGTGLWSDDFELDYESLFYPPPPDPIPVSTIYHTKQTKMRGKALEGFYRPTIAEFFTSKDYEEILTGITSDTFDTLNTDIWRPFTLKSGTIVTEGSLDLTNDGQDGQAGIISKGVIKGDFEVQIDFDASAFTTGLNGQAWVMRLHDVDYYVDANTLPTTDLEMTEHSIQFLFYENHVAPNHYFQANFWNGDSVVVVGAPSFNKIGKLKYKRVGSSLELWYYINSWTLLATKTYLGTNDLYLDMYKSAWGAFPSHVVKLDNLLFTTGRLGY